MSDPWEEPVGIFLKQRERTPYVTFQDIYGVLDIPAARQSSDNAKRIHQIATDCGSGSNPPQGWHLIGASQGVLPRSRRQVNKRVNGCPRRPWHYAEKPLHTHHQSLFFLQLLWKEGQVGHDATDLTVAT